MKYLAVAVLIVLASCAHPDANGTRGSGETRGLPTRLLPRCLPPPRPDDVYGFHIEVLQVYGKDRLFLNGRPLALDKMMPLLTDVYGHHVTNVLYVSFEGGFYKDLLEVLDTVEPLKVHFVLLTSGSRPESEAGLHKPDCWFQF